MLLSKLIEFQALEPTPKESKHSKSTGEIPSAKRGLGIPESFCQLFHSDLAKSIVLAPLNSKKKGGRQKQKETLEQSTEEINSTCSTTTSTNTINTEDFGLSNHNPSTVLSSSIDANNFGIETSFSIINPSLESVEAELFRIQDLV